MTSGPPMLMPMSRPARAASGAALQASARRDIWAIFILIGVLGFTGLDAQIGFLLRAVGPFWTAPGATGRFLRGRAVSSLFPSRIAA
jgi:hypothetical protein